MRVRTWYRKRRFACLRNLLWVALAAGAGAGTGEFLINKIYFRESVVFLGSWDALLGNILIFFCFLVLLLMLTNRLLLAIFMGLSLYGFLVAGDTIKLIYLDNPLRPTDFQYLTDLRVVAKPFLHSGALLAVLAACAAVAVLSVLLWRKETPALARGPRLWIGAAAAAVLVSLFVLPSFDPVQEWITKHGIELPESWQFEPRMSARLNGLLVEWAMGAADPAFQRPANYSRSEIERITRAYPRTEDRGVASKGGDRPINLIIYLIESFMDPLDLGVRFTSDPIPTFRAISRRCSSGKVVVPVFGGTSANTEFELLTGLAMYFLPYSSCPYRQYVTRDIPSVPRLLHQHGYRTMAITADPPYLFNRKAVLGHLGFDGWLFPEADPNTPRSPDDEFAADEAIADATIAASRGSSPYFIFAFTGGTHFPWEYPNYRDSALDIVGAMPEDQHLRLKTYVNALCVADRSLEKLLAHFEKTDQRTAILIMGDHLPALAEIYDTTGFFKTSGLDRIRKRFEVPAVLWCNWPAAKEDFVCSANFVSILLLQFLGLRQTGSLALTADVRSHFPVLSQYVLTADGHTFAPQAPELPFQPLLDDYCLIQYDLLKGGQYALATPGWGK